MRFGFLLLPLAPFVLVHCVGDDPGSASPENDAGGGGDVVTNPDGSTPTTGTAQLTIDKTKSWIHQGETVDVGFTVVRTGATGPLSVRAVKLPAGVTAADVAVDVAGKGTLSFVAATAAPAGISADVDVELVDGASVADRKSIALRVAGAPGDPDITWGTAGVRTLQIKNPDGAIPTPGNAHGDYIVVEPPGTPDGNAGKVVVGGTVYATTDGASLHRPFIARFNADGTVDTTFGEPTAAGAKSGYRMLPHDYAWLRHIAVDSVGRVVAVGTGTSNRAFVARVTADGQIDSTFQQYYDNLSHYGYSGETFAVVILPQDKVLVGGYWNNYDVSGPVDCTGGNCSTHPFIARFNADGTPDTTLTANGFKLLANLHGQQKCTYLNDMVRDGQGRIVWTGAGCDNALFAAATGCKSAVARLTADGDYDATFGGKNGSIAGASEVSFGADPGLEAFSAVRLDANGDILAAGTSKNNAGATVVRFKAADGAVDSTFAPSTQAVDLGNTSQGFVSVLLDSSGRIITTGSSNDGSTVLQRLRFDTMGVRDTKFGPATIHIPGFNPYSAMTPDDQVVATYGAYRAGNAAPYDVAVARFWP